MEDQYRSQFRLPYPLYERLKDAASASGRSLNSEVVFRLEQSFNLAGDLTTVSDAQILQEMVKRFGGGVQITVTKVDPDQAP
ncbi:MAG TPA: Arc family DNA-binding protein [Noviherbaspirillum sp.]|nr:Arc family DNA-binding protein [Noviherbaspirillum sp.]